MLKQPDDVVLPGLHGPSPVHDPALPQAHELLHVSVAVPQLPQDTLRVAPGEQTPSPEQVP